MLVLYGDGEHDDTDAMDAVICDKQTAICISSQTVVRGADPSIIWPKGMFKRTRPLLIRGRDLFTLTAYDATIILPRDVEHLVVAEHCYKLTVKGLNFASDDEGGFDYFPDGPIEPVHDKGHLN